MKKFSVLFVDDEELVRMSIGEDLKRMGGDVTLAKSGEEAVRLIRERSVNNPFDLVISDLKMPGLSGIDVLKEAKKANPGTMFIIITGYSSVESAIDSIRFDVDDYIQKPCKSKELKFRVMQCIERLEYLRKIKLYENILPVCCVCKKIRDDENKEHGTGEWLDWQVYMRRKSKIDISHGYCPECQRKTLEDAKKLDDMNP